MGFELIEEKYRWHHGGHKFNQWVAKMDSCLDHGLMNISCGFEDPVKILLCVVHKVTNESGPLVVSGHRCHLWVGTMCWDLNCCLMNIWCEFGKDPLKTNGCRAQTRQVAHGP